jgi:hypothetical protein
MFTIPVLIYLTHDAMPFLHPLLKIKCHTLYLSAYHETIPLGIYERNARDRITK